MATGMNDDDHGESFGNRMVEIVQHGFASVGIAVGSTTGLFNTMATFDEPKTSREIADTAGLKERYVREWLGAMVTSKIVDIQSDTEVERYFLPRHRHKYLCSSKDGEGEQAILLEGIPMVCEVYKDVLECFKKDGPRGVTYAKYTLQPPWTDTITMRNLQERAPKFLTDRDELRRILESSSTVYEVGCGSGAALCYLARDFPKCEFHGIDVNKKTVMAAKLHADSMQLTNVTFHLGDASVTSQDWNAKFDIVYCMDVIHDVGRPDLLLKEIKRLLKDDGYFIMQDAAGHTKHADNLDRPLATIDYIISLFRCMPTSLYTEGGFGLGAMWGQERAFEILAEYGFNCFDSKENGQTSRVFYCSKEK
ncbi:S-adenosylmethionine-dependent methyltransferase Rv2258c-like [Glandiceps talaboti]